jgi:hypothetical protein
MDGIFGSEDDARDHVNKALNLQVTMRVFDDAE